MTLFQFFFKIVVVALQSSSSCGGDKILSVTTTFSDEETVGVWAEGSDSVTNTQQ